MTIDGRDRADVVAAIEARRRRRRHPAEGSDACCAGVVDALVDGGVRALEVTMTVPGAVELIRGLAPHAAGRVSPRRRHRDRRRDGARASSTPARRSSSARCSGRDVIAACHARDVPAMPGCFSPTEILDAWEAGADIVKVFPATALGPALLQGRARAAAAGQADADRRRHARQRRRLDSRRRGRRRRRHARCSTPTAIAAGDFDVDHAPTRGASSRTSRAARRGTLMAEGRHVRRDHAAAEPAGIRAVPPVAGAAGHLRRRRSERRGQPRALRPRELVRHAPAGARDRRRRGAGAARRRRAHRRDRARRRSRRHLLRRNRREPARVDGDLRPRAFGDQRDGAGRGRLGRACSPARRGSTSPASRRRSARRPRRPRARRSTAARAAGARVSIDLNFRKKLWTETQAQAVDAPADATASTSSSPTKRTCSRCSASRVTDADVTGGRLDLDGYRAAAERVARDFGVAHGRDHAAREPVGQRQRLERACSGTRRPERSIRASATTCGSSIASAAATASPRA